MASKSFEAAVRKVIAPRLAELGFRRFGTRYVRPCPPFGVQGLALIQSKWNGSGYCRFSFLVTRSLKLGVSHDGLVERARRDNGLFDTDAFRFQRTEWLGTLTEVRADFQYGYLPDDAAGIEAAQREALADIERYALPFLRWGVANPLRGHDQTRAAQEEARWHEFIGIPAPSESASATPS